MSGALSAGLSVSVVSNLSKYKMSTVFESQEREQLVASRGRRLRLRHVRNARVDTAGVQVFFITTN